MIGSEKVGSDTNGNISSGTGLNGERKSIKLLKPLATSLQRVWKTYIKGGEELVPDHGTCPDEEMSTPVPLDDELPDWDNSIQASSSSIRCDNDQYIPGINNYLVKNLAARCGIDSDTESVVSDYSEMADPVKEHLANVQIIHHQKFDWNCSSQLIVRQKIPRGSGEDAEEYMKRLRKANCLSLAQEFAELKKHNADALPFNLHEDKYVENLDDSDSEMEDIEASTESCSATDAPSCNSWKDGEIDSGYEKDDFSECQFSAENLPEKTVVLPALKSDAAVSNVESSTTSTPEDHPVQPRNPFDSIIFPADCKRHERNQVLYDYLAGDIEATFPEWDLQNVEDLLLRATEEQDKQQAQCGSSDRDEIRRKLASVRVDDDDEWYRGEMQKGNIAGANRRRSSMSLEMCFINKAADDLDVDPSQPESFLSGANVVEEYEDESHGNELLMKQARLEAEARLALAQIRPVIQVQMEAGKHVEKVDSTALSTENLLGRDDRPMLEFLYSGQLQTIANDLHTQIENLNRELMIHLVEREDLHIVQDSMLVDIEDLTGRAREFAAKVDDGSGKKRKSLQKVM